MPVFFIDNQQMWPANAKLLKDLVLWPDAGKYPSYQPVALASHPEFEGKIVVQAGNRGIVVTLVPGAETPNDIRVALSAKQTPEQYRVAIDSIIHAIMLMRADSEGHGEVHPFSLLTMLAKVAPIEAGVILAALNQWIRNPTPLPDDQDLRKALIQSGEDMISTLKRTIDETEKPEKPE